MYVRNFDIFRLNLTTSPNRGKSNAGICRTNKFNHTYLVEDDGKCPQFHSRL